VDFGSFCPSKGTAGRGMSGKQEVLLKNKFGSTYIMKDPSLRSG